jgi:hypothetical protein
MHIVVGWAIGQVAGAAFVDTHMIKSCDFPIAAIGVAVHTSAGLLGFGNKSVPLAHHTLW